MNGKFRRFGAAALVIGALMIGTIGGASAAELERRGGPAGNAGPNAQASGYLLGSGTLDAAEEAALEEAMYEEYGALNTYQAVIDQFGAVLPFSRIVRAEQQHVNALARLFAAYGLEVPANPGLATIPEWDTLGEACQTGVDAEIADAALYDELKPQVDNADILRVFDNLQAASLDNHLPAFEACN